MMTTHYKNTPYKHTLHKIGSTLGLSAIACSASFSLAEPRQAVYTPEINFEISTLKGIDNTLQIGVEIPFQRFAAFGIDLIKRPFDSDDTANHAAPEYGIHARIELHRDGSFETGWYSALFLGSEFTPDASIDRFSPEDNHFDRREKMPCHADSFNFGASAGYQWFLNNGLNASVGGGAEAIYQDAGFFNDACDDSPWHNSRGFAEIRLGYAI